MKNNETNQKYFLLSTLLSEDKELRHRLSLEKALHVQTFERNDANFLRQCLFCKLIYEGNRIGYIKHLSEDHNLQLGNPYNLVFIDDLIEQLDKKLQELKCIFCEKTFPDRQTLKEHMRHKIHKRINCRNTFYDKYYIVNYLESKEKQRDNSRDIIEPQSEQNADLEYSDWCENDELINCLFCKHTKTDIQLLCKHMSADHDFNFSTETEEFDFYQKIKLVNYIRRQVHKNACINCDYEAENSEEFLQHLKDEHHCNTLPDLKKFDQPEYYFPTYENDTFLYLIDDIEDLEEDAPESIKRPILDLI